MTVPVLGLLGIYKGDRINRYWLEGVFGVDVLDYWADLGKRLACATNLSGYYC